MKAIIGTTDSSAVDGEIFYTEVDATHDIEKSLIYITTEDKTIKVINMMSMNFHSIEFIKSPEHHVGLMTKLHSFGSIGETDDDYFYKIDVLDAVLKLKDAFPTLTLAIDEIFGDLTEESDDL
jgi:hypothetical protein